MWFILSFLPFAGAQTCDVGLPGLIKKQNVHICGELDAYDLSVGGKIGTLGDAILTDYSAGYERAGATWTLTIGGALTTEDGSVASGVRVGDHDGSSIAGTMTYDGFGTHSKNITSRCEEAQDLSEALSGLSDNGEAVFDGYATLTLTGTEEQSVFTIDSDTLSDSRLILIHAGERAIIRVTGDIVSWDNGAIVSSATDAEHILWVLDEASDVSLSNTYWNGGLLAMNASTVDVHSVAFEGQLIAGDLDASAVLTNTWFGDVRFNDDIDTCEDPVAPDVTYAINYDNPDATCWETCAIMTGHNCDADATDALWEDPALCGAMAESWLTEASGETYLGVDFCDYMYPYSCSADGLDGGCLVSPPNYPDFGEVIYTTSDDPGGCDATGSSFHSTTRVCACSGDLPDMM